jgi:hypothetical protein
MHQDPLAVRNDRDDELEPFHAASPTACVLDELQLYGNRPHQDEPDPRPLPDQRAVEAALADVFYPLVLLLNDTRLEPDLEDLLWSTVNLFHRAAGKVQRDLDRNEDEQKRSQAEQDGSEIRSVELERLTAEAVTMIERRNAFQAFRNCAADHLGRPRSRFRQAPGHSAYARRCDQGGEFIASRWEDARKVTQMIFGPDWSRHGKAAPFERNGWPLATLPIGVTVFRGSGITDNLADKARGLGIPVYRFGGGARGRYAHSPGGRECCEKHGHVRRAYVLDHARPAYRAFRSRGGGPWAASLRRPFAVKRRACRWHCTANDPSWVMLWADRIHRGHVHPQYNCLWV